jgi:hypothetical protein
VTFGKPPRRIQGIRALALELAGIGEFQKIAKPSLFCGGDRRGNRKNSENPNLIMGQRMVRPKNCEKNVS